VVFAAILKLLKLGKETTRAVRIGFGWLTVAETLADRRGDTGALIAGVREYAAITPAARVRLRRTRLLAEVALFGAAVMPLLAILPLAWFASMGVVGTSWAPLVLLVPSTALTIAAAFLQRRETRAVESARARLRKHHKAIAEDRGLVRTWNETLNDVRFGQDWGAGPSSRPLAGRIAATGAVLTLMLPLVVVAPVGLIGAFGPAFFERLTFDPAGALNRIRAANIVRSFELPPDSTVSPLDAGRAFFALSEMGRTPPTSTAFPQKPVSIVFEESWFDQPFPDHLFVREGTDSGTHNARDPGLSFPSYQSIIGYAAGGLRG
jgi:hypothetical protein